MPLDTNISILVVDDHPAMVLIIKILLRQMGFVNIHEACDGKTALEKIRQRPYDLIFSDWDMQPMTGIDLLKQVRATNPTVPFIMITAEGKVDNVLAARNAGGTSYIVKPFTFDTLKAKIFTVMGGK